MGRYAPGKDSRSDPGCSMTDKLPPLPDPIWGYSTSTPKFSADQMHAYACAALQALEDEAEASIKEMIDKGLGQVQPVAWQAIGGSIWNHKTSEDDRALYTATPCIKEKP
jgi:hypothetical protein